ncbi:hypothetical protein SLA2020_435980 [Shorea laevis]
MSQYEVDIQNVKVKARVVDTGVSELRTTITHKQQRLVDLDLKFDRSEAAFLIVLSRFDQGFKFNMQELYKRYLKCKSGVELGYLAARVLKNPDLMHGHRLEKLTDIAGMKTKQSTVDCTKTTSWKARVFSVEQVQIVVLGAHNAYLLGNKFLDIV